MSRQEQDVDELFDIKNCFYIGNYSTCINEAQKLKSSSPETSQERDIFIYRAYIAQQKYRVALDEISSTSVCKLQSLKLLGEYFAYPQKRDAVIAQLEQKLSNTEADEILILVGATIYLNEKQLESALRLLNNSDNLECMGLMLQILLIMDRVDLARKKLKEMQEKDDDATLTQLAQAWLHISMGGDKLQDAIYIFQEMVAKYGSTPLLLNGQAVALIAQQNYPEALSVLELALDKDGNMPDTLINMYVLSQHLGKSPEVVNRYFSQLKDSQEGHPFITDYRKKETDFDQLCMQYKASNPVSRPVEEF